MSKTYLRSAMLVLAGTLVGAGAALAEEPTLSHPADPVPIPSGPALSNAFDLAVPLVDRPAAHPSYGPAPAEGAVDPVEQSDQMMDHSGHQMPGMNMRDMPGVDHSGHQMPGMIHDATPENSQ